MSIFNLTDEKMKETSSTFTAHEIYQQPATCLLYTSDAADEL